jgi:redox-sensing transcriptional repressor
MGSALYSYKEFHRQGFDIVAVFDVSPDRVGQRWKDVTIQHVDRLAAEVARLGIELGVIAVPARAAQAAADRLVAAGVRGILNFAHRKLFVPQTATLRNVNLSLELEGLAFAIKASAARPARGAPRRRRAG